MTAAPSDSLDPGTLRYLSKTSLVPPPPGVASNLDDPSQNHRKLLHLNTFLFALTVIFILIRGYVKARIDRKFSIDDFTLFIGFLGATAYYVLAIWGMHDKTYGAHAWDISLLDYAIKEYAMATYLTGILTSFTLGCIKVSYFLMFFNIFGQWRWMRICSIIGGVLTVSFYITMTTCGLVYMTPRRGQFWTSEHMLKMKWVGSTFAVPQSAVGLGIDLYIMILPIIAVSRLQMKAKRKIGISIVFMIAILAVLGSILSIVYRVKMNQSPDVTWVLITVFMTTLLELQLGILILTVPAVNHLYRHILSSYRKRASSATRTSTRYWSQSPKDHLDSDRKYSEDSIHNVSPPSKARVAIRSLPNSTPSSMMEIRLYRDPSPDFSDYHEPADFDNEEMHETKDMHHSPC